MTKRQVINLPDLSGHSAGQLNQAGEDYLAYSDEQWHMAWEELEESDRQRGLALIFRFMSQHFLYSRPWLSHRYHRGCVQAQAKSEEHRQVAAEYREVAEEAETASHVVFEFAEQRISDSPP